MFVDVDISEAPSRSGRGRAVHRVVLRASGEVLCESANPEFEACRVLLKRGIRGTLRTFFPGKPNWRMRMDIEAAASLAAHERQRDSMKIDRRCETPQEATLQPRKSQPLPNYREPASPA